MKVLVISHNVFSDTQSMGKTLANYFSGFNPKDLAQFYIHNQIPTINCCNDYYRITDKEVIQSIFGKSVGKSYQSDSSFFQSIDVDTSEFSRKIYQNARKRTPLTYIARNIWWRAGHWYNKKFRCWLDRIAPDCVFFASGDYAFMYNIALKIATSRRIPLYVSCMDDYYLYNKNNNSVLGKIQHSIFMKTVRKTIDYASCIFCICEKMSMDYESFFSKKTITIHTPSSLKEPLHEMKKNKICYLGNLGHQRDKQLIGIGKALKELNLSIDHIDVYSTEDRSAILSGMTIDNGIVFHGPVEADEVKRIMGESLAVIHTESFDDTIRCTIRYSVSSKISDSLMSGTCIFAYGPDDIASIEYLQRNYAAICCTNAEDLSKKLKQLICDDNLRVEVQNNAIKLANQNHMYGRTNIFDSICQ